MKHPVIETENQNLNPVSLDGQGAKYIKDLHLNLRSALDSLFTGIEYDAHGEVVNRIEARIVTEAVSLPVMSDVDVHIPGTRTLVISVSSTLRQAQEYLTRLEVKDAVDSASNSSGFTRSISTGNAVVRPMDRSGAVVEVVTTHTVPEGYGKKDLGDKP